MRRDQPKLHRCRVLSLRKKLAFSVVVTSIFALVLYMGSICVRSARLYHFVKDNQRGWRGRALAPDALLGFGPIPGAEGLELVPLGQALPVRFDDDGFRIPLNGPGSSSDHSPTVLALGCSFTYGEVCLAEETYSGVLARQHGYRSMNAGITSYGLAQMLILAHRLIPRHRPDYVVVQYSPWLVQRSRNYYAHLSFGTTPVPFFTETPSGALQIHPPVFRSKVATMSVDEYRGRPSSLSDYFAFLFKVGGPLLLHDDYHISVHRLKRITGLTPAPASDTRKIEDHVYREIWELCRQYHSKMVILILGNNNDPVSHGRLDLIDGATIVDAHAALLGRLAERTPSAFRSMYGHWRGEPPILVDEHPNAVAHRIIADELARALGGHQPKLTEHRPMPHEEPSRGQRAGR